MIPIKLDALTDADRRLEHCRALSSDEDSLCEADMNKNGLSSSADAYSSGYSSVQSVSPASTCSSSLVPCTLKTFTTCLGVPSANALPGFHLLVPMQRPRGTSSKQVKRKNSAAHSGGEVEGDQQEEGNECSVNCGFLSL